MKFGILLFALILNACSFKVSEEIKNNSPLNYIESYSKLSLETINERCGEWGGDKELIIIYRDLRQDIFYADYFKEIINCDDPYADSSKNNMTYAKRITMDLAAQKLAKECVEQLVEFKLQDRKIPVHSGINNSAIISDSSFILNYYPSRNWDLFFKLRDRLFRNQTKSQLENK